ncbi:hypothetical protein BZZ01_32830 (plasmid) [Nostocales cyanobacterium HT-58-2]|nr:hypothetical protein BZZ01_32830 [Nostocales cyanobacterium HT-58-2]
MTEVKGLYKTSTNRNEYGQFAPKEYGNKKLRSMMLSDDAWQILKQKADEQGISRTDVMEELVRHHISEQEIVLRTLKKFIEHKRQSYGNNAAQKQREFSTDTRSWDAFREFLKLVEISPCKLGLDE